MQNEKSRLKFTVNGFHQLELVRHGLDCVDAVILEYISDLSTCKNLNTSIGPDGMMYFWVNYTAIRQALPIINLTNKSIGRRLKKYAVEKILKLWINKNKTGTYSMICFDAEFDTLKYSKI